MKNGKMMKRAMMLLVVLALALTALAAGAFADEGEHTMYCTARSGLMVRTEPNTNAPSVGSFAYGQDVRVTGNPDANGWVQVEYNGFLRYVYASYLSGIKPADSSFGWLKTNSNVAQKQDYRVKVSKGYLALRNGCTFDSSNEIAQLANGTPVQLINNGNGTYWTVYVPSLNKTGYVNSNYLE